MSWDARMMWLKAVRDGWLLCVSLALLEFSFNWLFVWLTNQIELGAMALFLQSLPKAFEQLAGLPFAQVATPTGRIAMSYLHPVIEFAILVWCVGRGSDVVSGEIGRGTMEIVLAQPVRRIDLIVSHAAVTTAGSLAICLAAWLGTSAGIATVKLPAPVAAAHFLPGAANMFALMFFLAAASTLVSACDNYRWRTIGILGAFYIVELILKAVARMAPHFDWLMYLSFLGAYEPQIMILQHDQAWAMSLPRDGVLIGMGLVAYAAATAVFCQRDLPAPA
jgi:ABC-2 type transport system permease protein